MRNGPLSPPSAFVRTCILSNGIARAAPIVPSPAGSPCPLVKPSAPFRSRKLRGVRLCFKGFGDTRPRNRKSGEGNTKFTTIHLPHARHRNPKSPLFGLLANPWAPLPALYWLLAPPAPSSRLDKKANEKIQTNVDLVSQPRCGRGQQAGILATR